VDGRLDERIGSLPKTGHWKNPASPALLDVDPLVDAWAKSAFQAVLDSLKIKDAAAMKAAHFKARAPERNLLETW
jgi:hypothetical protein